jgi:GAF domain-containing protein/anti-sigma regulatory factor (Ser/Thr protein kinase)
MTLNESKTFSLDFAKLRDVDSCISELKKLHTQLEEERSVAQKKERMMTNSLQESKQMSNHLQQITHALTRERKQASEKTERERLLWRLIERINSTFDLDHILQATVDELGHYFKVNRCGIIIPNYKKNKDLVREFAMGEWSRTQDVYSQVTLSVLYRTVIKTMQPLIINDTLTHELTSGHLSEDLRSLLMVPLVRGNNELVGVVYLHQCRTQRTWGEHETSMLQSAAGAIATAVEKSKLFNRARSWASREKLLNRLTSRIRGTLNINVILERTVVELGQALMASRCFISIIDPKTSREKISHEYTAKNATPLGVKKEFPLIINKLIEKNVDCVAITDIYKEPRLAKLNNKEIEQIYQTNARSFLAVPISFQTKLFGWLCFHQCNVPRNWSEEEIAFIQSAASQVGVAINQAEMVEELTEYQTKLSRELKQAANLQSVLLSAGSDTKKNLPIAVSYHPHHNVSGDFYWICELAPHVVGILIGDVSGKGPAAALLTGYIIGEIKGLLENQDTAWHPEKFLTALGDSIYEQNQYSDFYATAWYGIFNILENKIICSNAGHPSPYLMDGQSISKLLDDPGAPLGLLSTKDVGAYVDKEFKLKTGDRVMIFTDGLTEQRQLEGNFLPESWLSDALKNHDKYELKDLPEEIIRKLNIASKAAPQDDDRLVVAIEMPEKNIIEFYDDKQDYLNERVQQIIDDAVSKGLPSAFISNVKLGLIEALYNSFRHGLTKENREKKQPVSIVWWVKDSTFSCAIKDPGPGFDWQDALRKKSKMTDVDILSEGGRGVPLLMEIFNKVNWNPEGNEVGLVLKW